MGSVRYRLLTRPFTPKDTNRASHNFGYSIAVITLGTIAFAFSVLVLTTCQFIKNGEGNIYADLSSGFGLFSVDVEGVCQNYANNKTEGAHSAAKGFGILTSLSLGAAVISAILASARFMGDDRRLPATWNVSRSLFGVSLASSLLTMLMFAGPYKSRVCQEVGDCKPGFGAGLNIANILLLAGTSLLSFFTSAPPPKANDTAEAFQDNDDDNNEKDVEAQDNQRAIDSVSEDTKSSKAVSEAKSETTAEYSKVDNEVVGGSPSWNPCNACLH